MRAGDAGLFADLAACGVLDRLALVDVPLGQQPLRVFAFVDFNQHDLAIVRQPVQHDPAAARVADETQPMLAWPRHYIS